MHLCHHGDQGMSASDYNQDLAPGLSTGLGRTVAPSHQAPAGPLDAGLGILIAGIILIAIAFVGARLNPKR
jgi:hypothetical protein